MITVRDRSQVDNRHMIRDPMRAVPMTNRIDLLTAAAWSNTLVKTRIPQLFLTLPGLPGHVMQLQNELNRFKISKLEGCRVDEISGLIAIMKFVRKSIKKSMKATNLPLPNNLFLEFPFISDRLKI